MCDIGWYRANDQLKSLNYTLFSKLEDEMYSPGCKLKPRKPSKHFIHDSELHVSDVGSHLKSISE